MIFLSAVRYLCCHFSYIIKHYNKNFLKTLNRVSPKYLLFAIYTLASLLEIEGSGVGRGECFGYKKTFGTMAVISAGFYPSTFLQSVNSSKNSILNWVLKLNFFKSLQVLFFVYSSRKTLDRFFILLQYCFCSCKPQNIQNKHA